MMRSCSPAVAVNHTQKEISCQLARYGIAALPKDDRKEHVLPGGGQGCRLPVGSCSLLLWTATKCSEVINKQSLEPLQRDPAEGLVTPGILPLACCWNSDATSHVSARVQRSCTGMRRPRPGVVGAAGLWQTFVRQLPARRALARDTR